MRLHHYFLCAVMALGFVACDDGDSDSGGDTDAGAGGGAGGGSGGGAGGGASGGGAGGGAPGGGAGGGAGGGETGGAGGGMDDCSEEGIDQACLDACARLADCAFEDEPEDLCPAYENGDTETRDALYCGCLPACTALQAQAVSSQADCAGVVNLSKTFSEDFTAACEDTGGGGAGGEMGGGGAGGEMGGGGAGGEMGGGGAGGEMAGDLEADVQAVFDSACSPCHISGASGGLSLVNFVENSVGVASNKNADINRIEAGDPDNSLIYLRVLEMPPPEAAPRMPLGGQAISEDDRETIRLYIESLGE
jgi:hypothetical protein